MWPSPDPTAPTPALVRQPTGRSPLAPPRPPVRTFQSALVQQCVTAHAANNDTSATPSADTTSALARLFDADRRGRLIVDQNLNLRWCNNAGRALLNGHGPLMVRDGILKIHNQSERDQFVAFMRRVTDQVSAYCVRTEDELNHLVLAARTLDNLPLIAVTAYLSGEAFHYAWANLCEAFGLTGVERETAQALMGGHTAEGVAQRTRTSVKTVRTHIRHVYSKLEVTSREGLFHKLAPYMLRD